MGKQHSLAGLTTYEELYDEIQWSQTKQQINIELI